ncbi:MAG TPA: response regulator, partial [Thermoanaerobaculia bacterium]|nr:response regulator [Thermoanaerobaculia bacterium]
MATPKILIVDDEPDLELLIRQKYRREIRDGRYAFTFAHNGREALEKLREDPGIEVVLSDINMPEMDGLTLLGQIRELANPVLKAVIVSAYGDM